MGATVSPSLKLRFCAGNPQAPAGRGLSAEPPPRVAVEVSLVLTPDSNREGDKMGFALSAGGLWELLQVIPQVGIPLMGMGAQG